MKESALFLLNQVLTCTQSVCVKRRNECDVDKYVIMLCWCLFRAVDVILSELQTCAVLY